MTTDDLVPWLRTQIAEVKKRRYEQHQFGCASFDNCGTCRSGPYGCDCTHPHAVLAQCEAHTSLVDFWSLAYSKPSDFPGPRWDQIRKSAEWTVKKVALAYQHNPGYREEWRP